MTGFHCFYSWFSFYEKLILHGFAKKPVDYFVNIYVNYQMNEQKAIMRPIINYKLHLITVVSESLLKLTAENFETVISWISFIHFIIITGAQIDFKMHWAMT